MREPDGAGAADIAAPVPFPLTSREGAHWVDRPVRRGVGAADGWLVLTIERASEIYRVPVALLVRLVNGGLLPAFRIGGRVMVRIDDVADLVIQDLRPAPDGAVFPSVRR